MLTWFNDKRWDSSTIPLSSLKIFKSSGFPNTVSSMLSKIFASYWRNPAAVIPLSRENQHTIIYYTLMAMQDLALISGTLKLPERALESFWFIPFNLSHLRKSLSDMELSNITASLAAGTKCSATCVQTNSESRLFLGRDCHEQEASYQPSPTVWHTWHMLFSPATDRMAHRHLYFPDLWSWAAKLILCITGLARPDTHYNKNVSVHALGLYIINIQHQNLIQKSYKSCILNIVKSHPSKTQELRCSSFGWPYCLLRN